MEKLSENLIIETKNRKPIKRIKMTQRSKKGLREIV